MSEQVKLTDEEIASVKGLREQMITIISTVGQLQLTTNLLRQDLTEAEDKVTEQTKLYKELLGKEKEVINSLLEKYGIGSLDIETGVFTPDKK
jgi:regulator of replication initiation timing